MRASLLLVLMLVGCDTIKPPPSTDTDGEDTAAAGACLELSATSVEFGDISKGVLLDTTITASNPCSEELVISSITVDAPFQVAPGYLTLAPGAFSTISVFVQPTEYGTFQTDITLTTDEPSLGTGGVVTIPVSATTIDDVDGDGFPTTGAGGTDCDDEDADVNPDAEETWYDGVDQNCDGANDFDQDGDGWDAETDDHELPEGQADCNDTNVEFNPAAEDVPYDNRDSNCDDSNDWDYDDDGYESAAYGRGSDCDDFDAGVNRDGIEQFNGKDDDCDGTTDNDALASASDYWYAADGTWDRTGYSVAIGDLNADGVSEFVVGAPYVDSSTASGAGRGGVAIFEGPALLPAATAIDNADNFFDGDGGSDLVGVYVSVIGDFDGDGVNDLAVGATGASAGGSNAGAVYVLGGDDARRGDLGDAIATYTGTTSNYFGRGIATDIDLDGDGMQELIVAYASSSYNAIAVQYGDTSPTSASVTSMDAKWTTDGTEVAFYRNAPVGGDLDGDGYQDLLVSDGKGDFGSTDSGVAWALWGQGIEYVATTASDFDATATVIMRGTSSSDYDAWSTQLGDDWDGDGDAELWVYNADEALYVVEGGTNRRSPFDPSTEYAVSYVWNASTPDAEMIRKVGDYDGDGVGDMLVFIEDESGSYGLSELFPSSNRSGVYNELDAILGNLTGNSDETLGDNGNVGYGMAPKAGDLDGDGDLDMAVGDPEFNSNEGAAYVLLNEAQVGE